MSESGGWREKYLDSLDEQERLEKLTAAQGDMLRRLLINLSAALAGLDAELDGSLTILKEKLRGAKGAAVHDHVLRLESIVQGYEARRSAQLNDVAQRMRDILASLQELNIPSSLQQTIADCLRSLNRHPLSFPTIPEQLKQVALLHKQILTAAQQPPENFWQRLRGGFRLAQESDGLNDGVQEKATSDERDLAAPECAAIGDKIKRLLGEILDGLVDKERASELWQRAKLRTEKSMDWQQLEETLIDLKDLLAGREKGLDQAISSYLSQVNQELHGICERLGIGLLAQHKQGVAADLLGQTVTDQMQSIQSSIDNSTNLDGLKQDIRLHISVINDALQTFRNQQSQARLPSEELQALIDRVKTIESESAQTKELLEKERHRANHDALTELPNREAYNQRVQLEWQRFRRYGRPLTLAVVDIDRFKQLNDQYGHQVGDKVLRLVAQTLAKRLRAVDFVARYGGEEFVVLLPETGVDDAFQVMDSARQAIADSAFRFKNKPVVLTFSCGLSGFTADDEISAVFERADKALYSAKNNGRNQTYKG